MLDEESFTLADLEKSNPDEVKVCKCGTKFWVKWHISHDRVSKCGPCFFASKRERENDKNKLS